MAKRQWTEAHRKSFEESLERRGLKRRAAGPAPAGPNGSPGKAPGNAGEPRNPRKAGPGRPGRPPALEGAGRGRRRVVKLGKLVAQVEQLTVQDLMDLVEDPALAARWVRVMESLLRLCAAATVE